MVVLSTELYTFYFLFVRDTGSFMNLLDILVGDFN